MGNYKSLRVWNEGIDLSVKIYKTTKTDLFSKDYGLSRQVQRANVSISSNIAEGDERNSNKEAVHFFNIAKGSVAEVITQLTIAYKIGYINEATFSHLENQAEKISATLKNLIKKRREKM